MVLKECLMNKTKKCNSVIFSNLKTKRGSGMETVLQWLDIWIFRERESVFSIGFRSIGPLVFDGARNKVALRGEGYTWVLIWWSSDNSKR